MSYVASEAGKLVGYALLSILFGFVLCCRETGILWRNQRIEARGLLADARIVERSSDQQDDNVEGSLYVTVNFVSEGGKRLNTVINVSEEFLRTHAAPALSHVQVRYLLDDPTVASIVGEPRSWAKTGIGLLMITGGVVGVGFGIWGFQWEESR